MAALLEKILSYLDDIERNHHVKIVYACESGSRAWGFPSADSDYDVRFLYIHPMNWYLTVEHKRDVIECPIDGKLDINGWNIRKALQLLRKSNPPLFEWLYSPIVYSEQYSIANRMRELAKTYYSPSACIYHYLHMAKGNYREYLQGDDVRIKKYLYVLRPILAIKWIEAGYGVSPTAFGLLLERTITDEHLKSEIRELIDMKRKGDELDHGPRNRVISEFIEEEMKRLENITFYFKNKPAPYEKLDRLLQEGLREVWQ